MTILARLARLTGRPAPRHRRARAAVSAPLPVYRFARPAYRPLYDPTGYWTWHIVTVSEAGPSGLALCGDATKWGPEADQTAPVTVDNVRNAAVCGRCTVHWDKQVTPA